MEGGDDIAKFNLLWKSHSKALSEATTSLLLTGNFSDVTLSCEGQKIKCHRAILSAFSPHLANAIEEMSTSNGVIHFGNGIKFRHLHTLLKFIYNGEAEVTQEDMPGVLKAAEELKIKGLTAPPMANEIEKSSAGEEVETEDDMMQDPSTTSEIMTAASKQIPQGRTRSHSPTPGVTGTSATSSQLSSQNNNSTDNDDNVNAVDSENGETMRSEGINGEGNVPKKSVKRKRTHKLARKPKAHLLSHIVPPAPTLVPTSANSGDKDTLRTSKKKRRRSRKLPSLPTVFGENMKKAVDKVLNGEGLTPVSKEFRIPISTLSKFVKYPERMNSSKVYYFPYKNQMNFDSK